MDNGRKLFKFYKSYLDVMNELPEKNQLEFIKALLNKQFYNIDPELKGIVKLAYISQKHSIDRQVQGFIDKTGYDFSDPMQGGAQGGVIDPKLQLEIEVQTEIESESKSKRENEFEDFWDAYGKKVDRKKCETKFLKLSDSEVKKILNVVENYVKSTPDEKYRKHPYTWLNGECWNDEINIKSERKYTAHDNMAF